MFKHVTMDMPSSQQNGYFIAEYREAQEERILILHRYSSILEKKLQDVGYFLVEKYNNGIIVKKKVDESRDDMDEWEEWVEFSNALLEEFDSFFDNI